jgi:hypothetical protein
MKTKIERVMLLDLGILSDPDLAEFEGRAFSAEPLWRDYGLAAFAVHLYTTFEPLCTHAPRRAIRQDYRQRLLQA